MNCVQILEYRGWHGYVGNKRFAKKWSEVADIPRVPFLGGGSAAGTGKP